MAKNASVAINQLFQMIKIKNGAKSCRGSPKEMPAQKTHSLEMAFLKTQ
jgi:hypothetical protein